jgi:hypothetical protein
VAPSLRAVATPRPLQRRCDASRLVFVHVGRPERRASAPRAPDRAAHQPVLCRAAPRRSCPEVNRTPIEHCRMRDLPRVPVPHPHPPTADRRPPTLRVVGLGFVNPGHAHAVPRPQRRLRLGCLTLFNNSSAAEVTWTVAPAPAFPTATPLPPSSHSVTPAVRSPWAKAARRLVHLRSHHFGMWFRFPLPHTTDD